MVKTIESQDTLGKMEQNFQSLEAYIEAKGTEEEFNENLLKKVQKYLDKSAGENSSGGDIQILDGWENSYEFDKKEDSYVMRSPGRDGKSGTEDDISMTMEWNEGEPTYSVSVDAEAYASPDGGSYVWVILLIGALCLLGFAIYLRKK